MTTTLQGNKQQCGHDDHEVQYHYSCFMMYLVLYIGVFE